MEDGCYRKRPVKSEEKGLATLDRVFHCAAEIITELSRSSFNASIEEKKKHQGRYRYTQTWRASKIKGR